MGQAVPPGIPVSLLIEDLLDLLHGVLVGGVELEDPPHHGGGLRVDHQLAVLLLVAPDPVAQDVALLNALGVAPLYPFADLPALIFRIHQLLLDLDVTVGVIGVQVVVEKDDGDAPVLQVLDVLQSLHGVPPESGDLAGDQQVIAAGGACGQQFEEVLPLFGSQAALAVVDEGLHKGPVGVALHIVPEVVGHVVEGGRLGLLLRTDPGVGGAAQGDVINVAGLVDQVPQFINGQMDSLPFQKISLLICQYRGRMALSKGDGLEQNFPARRLRNRSIPVLMKWPILQPNVRVDFLVDLRCDQVVLQGTLIHAKQICPHQAILQPFAPLVRRLRHACSTSLPWDSGLMLS